MIEYPGKVLLATDGADDSTRAARVAVAMADRAELHVVHVGQAVASVYGPVAQGGNLPGEPPGYAERLAQRLLEQQVKEIRAEGGAVTEAHLRLGQPAPEVVALATDLDADLVVVGSGGPHAMRRAVARTTRRATLGMVAHAIVRAAPCPVLVVRGDGIFSDREADTKEGDG